MYFRNRSFCMVSILWHQYHAGGWQVTRYGTVGGTNIQKPSFFLKRDLYVTSDRSRIYRWGAPSRWVGVDLQCRRFLAKRMRKQKNWVPFVGRGVWRRWRPLDPPMVTEIINFLTIRFSTDTCLLNIQMLCVQHRK